MRTVPIAAPARNVVIPIGTPLRCLYEARVELTELEAAAARIPRSGPHRLPTFRRLIRQTASLADYLTSVRWDPRPMNGYTDLVLALSALRKELMERMPVPKNLVRLPVRAQARFP